MHAVERFPYSDGALPGHQLLSMPFANSNTSMVFVLPMMDGTETVLSTDVMAALEDLHPTRLALAVPKFKFESAYTNALEDALFQLGIGGLLRPVPHTSLNDELVVTFLHWYLLAVLGHHHLLANWVSS